MRIEALKIGDVARRTGLTVRTLHHYDEIGLLRPSMRTETGHRLYTAADLGRLQQILSLRQLGFALEDIRACLEQAGFSPAAVIRMHVARLKAQIDLQRRLCERLEAIGAHLEAAEVVSVDQFLNTIEVMNMIEKYYTPEQLEYLKQRREEIGEDRMRQSATDWETLIAGFRAAMEQGIDPADPAVQALERRRQALIREFTGGDAGIESSLRKMWREQRDTLTARHGMDADPRVYEYMGRVRQAAEAGE
jgi:DNA-binding transcriptional MerR regulator